jgi:hypothetical protein
MAELMTVAAYRDRWQVRGVEPVGSCDRLGIERIKQDLDRCMVHRMIS